MAWPAAPATLLFEPGNLMTAEAQETGDSPRMHQMPYLGLLDSELAWTDSVGQGVGGGDGGALRRPTMKQGETDRPGLGFGSVFPRGASRPQNCFLPLGKQGVFTGPCLGGGMLRRGKRREERRGEERRREKRGEG